MSSTTDRNDSCEARIAGHMTGRDDQLGELYEAAERYDDIEAREEAQDQLWELPLSVETVRTVKVLLSTGGPADGLTIELNADGEVSTVRYWFADWFDYAETRVDEGSSLWRYAEEIAETTVVV